MIAAPHDIFISYTRADDAWVRRLVSALRVRWSVTWDQDIGLGAEWRAAIDEALDAATVVIVVWSARSSVAQYVLAEAGRANGRKALLPVCMEPIKPPEAFVHVNAADLSAWTDDDCPPKLAAAIEEWLARPRTPQPSVADQVVDALAKLGIVAHAGEHGLARDTILQLAQRLKPDETLDFAQAVTEVRNAVAIALDLIRAGERGTNHDAFVNAVLRRVAANVSSGRFDAAAEELDAELAAIEERAQRSTVVLLERAIEVDTLRRDPDAVAARIARLATLHHPDDRAAWHNAVYGQWDRYYDEGDQRGINLPLDIAIAITRQALSACATSDELGFWHNNQGLALKVRGERESTPDHLEQAVVAFRVALEKRPRERVPLKWARVQMNLGTALRSLGARESGTARTEEAVSAYRAALEERTRERVPLEWAATQMNLGVALSSLGERESGTARLHEAVSAYRAALEEFTRERVAPQWARTQMNLGNALSKLGERESGTTRMEEAVSAYRAALEERTRERVPQAWAMTQTNLGNALATLGEREGGTARLEEAVSACRAALEELTLERAPYLHGVAQGHLDGALALLAERRKG